MGNRNIYATIEDISTAIEIVREESYGYLTIDTRDINNLVSVVNLACIRDIDRVRIWGYAVEVIVYLASYLHHPEKIDICKNTIRGMNDNTSKIMELLENFNHTEAEMVAEDNIEAKYDVIFADCIKNKEESKDYYLHRFKLEAGEEYIIFQEKLIEAGKLLKEEGMLLMLLRPSWLLKAWSLLEELGLQLEYKNYKVYMEEAKHPNTTLWVRLMKKGKSFDIEMQKKNLLSLMEDNNIDRLYAHRNNLVFPYVELSYNNAEAFVKLDQDVEYLQYFFSHETTKNLANLCDGYTACLVTPSVAQYAYREKKDVVLFERDNRFREKKGLPFVKYDLYTGLTKLMFNKYGKKFNTVICDPPFDIDLKALARDIVELLKDDSSIAYVVFPEGRRISLINALAAKGLVLDEGNFFTIEYAKPPKLVRVHGKKAIQLYKFKYKKGL